jgi:hypothetical protein
MRVPASRVSVIPIVALLVLAGSRQLEATPFTIVSESAVFDPASTNVHFLVQFSRAPDLFTLDSVGRVADSFQYFIVGDPALGYPERFVTIIRGEEIHIVGDLIPLRDAHGSDADPHSGGWGPIRGSVPFLQRGNMLEFSVPLSLLTDDGGGGRFLYQVETYEFGAITGLINSQSSVVPEPTTVSLLGLGIVALFCSGVRSKYRPAAALARVGSVNVLRKPVATLTNPNRAINLNLRSHSRRSDAQ